MHRQSYGDPIPSHVGSLFSHLRVYKNEAQQRFLIHLLRGNESSVLVLTIYDESRYRKCVYRTGKSMDCENSVDVEEKSPAEQGGQD